MNKKLKKIIIATIVYIIAIIVSRLNFLTEYYFDKALFLISYFIVGWEILRKALNS